MYRALDRHLTAAGAREQIRFMGGDLVQTNQRAWFQYMATRLADLLDAYSVHIYWDYWDTAKFTRRLTEVQRIVAGLPASGRKPVFVSEYGVRGRAANVPAPGTYADGRPLGQTRIAAFQHAWFLIAATQLGYVGTRSGIATWEVRPGDAGVLRDRAGEGELAALPDLPHVAPGDGDIPARVEGRRRRPRSDGAKQLTASRVLSGS